MDSRAGQRRDIPHARREGVIDSQRGQNGNFRDVTAAGGFGANDWQLSGQGGQHERCWNFILAGSCERWSDWQTELSVRQA